MGIRSIFALLFLGPYGRKKWAISSVGSEHLPYKQGVTGSNPVSPTSKAGHEVFGFFIGPKSSSLERRS
jgi:hypothetical protein